MCIIKNSWYAAKENELMLIITWYNVSAMIREANNLIILSENSVGALYSYRRSKLPLSGMPSTIRFVFSGELLFFVTM